MTMDVNCIDIYVNGDGGTWSCSPSVLYQIPTEIFDLYMMLGRLNDREDLDALMDKICEDKIQVNEQYGCTDIWVGVGGNWSGLPSMHFKIPSDVFGYLQEKGNTEKTIGRLTTEDEDSLQKLIQITRTEMETGIILNSDAVTRTQPKNTEMKDCGHVCTTSSVKKGLQTMCVFRGCGCCSCEDLRPLIPEGTYATYIDGQGWANTGRRCEGYCPYCYVCK